VLEFEITGEELCFRPCVTAAFERTLRVPEDGRTYSLPPGLDMFPLFRVSDYVERVPTSWSEHGGVFIPLYQREALWISFSARWWKPNAVKVSVAGINAVTGRPSTEGLSADPQDYLVVPEQPWLDAYDAGGMIRQFVAGPLKATSRPEEPIPTGHEPGLIELVVFEPKVGRFPDTPPKKRFYPEDASCAPIAPATPCEMIAGPGGKMARRPHPDPYGRDAWEPDVAGRVCIHVVNTEVFREITGQQPPPTPITIKHYGEFGIPWLNAYGEGKSDRPAGQGHKRT
jgi:hypothetical protein